jgi:WXG100 family type VII secretion target
MAAAKVRADYAQLKQIAQIFAREAEACRQLLQRLKRTQELLQNGDWIGKGATAFYQEMDCYILPAWARLTIALEKSAETTTRILEIMQQTEYDVARLFQGNGAGNEGQSTEQNSETSNASDVQTGEGQGGDGGRTPTHQDIIDAANQTQVDSNVNEWDEGDILKWKAPTFLGGDPNSIFDFKAQWVHGYRDVIEAAAAKYNLPVKLVAGVAYVEVGGDPLWIDDVAHAVREFDHSGDPLLEPLTITKKPELTSFGNVSIQIRRAAEVLGYDPTHLTEAQEDMIVASLKDPRQNIFISAAHLAQLRDIDFAGKGAADMTADDIIITAARYNRGPDLTLDQIRENTSYGDFIDQRTDELQALMNDD